MTSLIVFLFLLISILFLIRGKRSLGLGILLISFFSMYLLATPFVTRFLLNQIQTYPFLKDSTFSSGKKYAFVLLGTGTTTWKTGSADLVRSHIFSYSRTHEVMRLYFQCRSQGATCKVILSGGDPSRHGLSEAEAMSIELMESKIPQEDIIIEKESKNTYENAQFSKRFLQEINPSESFLVTSHFHMRRSLLYFKKHGLMMTAAPSDFLEPAPSGWLPSFQNLFISEIALKEIFSYLRWS